MSESFFLGSCYPAGLRQCRAGLHQAHHDHGIRWQGEQDQGRDAESQDAAHHDDEQSDVSRCQGCKAPIEQRAAGLVDPGSHVRDGERARGCGEAGHPSERGVEEVGQRLIIYYKNSPNKDAYLVTGIDLTTDLASSRTPTFPEYEVTIGEEQ